MIRLREHVHWLDSFQSVPRFCQKPYVTCQRGGVAGDVYEPGRRHLCQLLQQLSGTPRARWVHDDHIRGQGQPWQHRLRVSVNELRWIPRKGVRSRVSDRGTVRFDADDPAYVLG